jgi:hypothetical protein
MGNQMPSFPQDFWQFSVTCWKSFEGLTTGGALAVFLTIWGFWVGHAPPSWVLFGSLAVYFFLAAFGAWREEHRLVLAGMPTRFTAARRAALKKKINALSPPDRKLFDEILIGGAMPVPADETLYPIGRIPSMRRHSYNRFARLISLGLVAKIDATNSYVVHPEILDDAKAVHDVQIGGGSPPSSHE